MQESCSGCTRLFPACSSPIFPRDGWAYPLSPCVCHALGVSVHGAPWVEHNALDLGHHLYCTGGQIQPSPQELHGTAWWLQATTSQESLLHQHHNFTQPVPHHRFSQMPHRPAGGGTRWDSHTESSFSVAKPCHQPGRCHRVPGCQPSQARPCCTQGQLSSLQGCWDDGVSCWSRGSQVNLSIHQGPHFLPSTLGDN